MLPLVIVVVVGLTGWQAFHVTSAAGGPWPVVFAALTVLGVAGPALALFIFRDSPDRFILVSAVLVALLPLVVLAYSLRSSPPL